MKNKNNSYDIYVDLDGTLIKTDILYESVLLLIKWKFLYLFILPFWLLKGKCNLKYQISQLVDINPKTLPYNKSFLNYLKEQHKAGRKLILATATTEKYAQAIADYLGIFSQIIASTDKQNVSGSVKLEKIKSNTKDFTYAGNASIDMLIFPYAKESLIVNPTRGLKRKLSNIDNISQVFESDNNTAWAVFKAIRMYQWVKNSLLFVPILMSQQFTNIDAVLDVIMAFLSFSLLASATYIVNDLIDIPNDREHIRKKNRPLASGNISIPTAILMSLVLFIIAFIIAFNINIPFVYGLVFYLVLTLLYSFQLKSYILIDTIALALLYTTRIFVGALVINITPSLWLIAFSMFIFLSLALVKRCSELQTLIADEKIRTPGRDYTVPDTYILACMGVASGFISVLIVILYLNDTQSISQYRYPEILWLVCPLLLYWVGRMWIKTFRDEMHDDPIVFTIKDKGSLICISCIFAIIITSILL